MRSASISMRLPRDRRRAPEPMLRERGDQASSPPCGGETSEARSQGTTQRPPMLTPTPTPKNRASLDSTPQGEGSTPRLAAGGGGEYARPRCSFGLGLPVGVLRIRQRAVPGLDFLHQFGGGVAGFEPRQQVRAVAVISRQRFRQQPEPRNDAQPGAGDVFMVEDGLGLSVSPAALDPVVAAVVGDLEDLILHGVIAGLPRPLVARRKTFAVFARPVAH